MRRSCYTHLFEIPGRSEMLLMHGYTGAMDVIRRDVAEDLRCLDDGPVSRIQSKTLLETLVERGYLTELTQEQEHDYIKQILALFKRKTSSSVSFAFQLQGRSSDIQETFVKRLDGVFTTMNQLRERYLGGVLAVDLTRVEGDYSFLPEIAKRSNDWSYGLLTTVGSGRAADIIPYLTPESIQYLRIASRGASDEGEPDAGLAECIRRVLDAGLKVDWLWYADGDQAQFERDYELARALREEAKKKRGKLNFILVSDGKKGRANPLIRVNGDSLQAVPVQDVFLYHFLGRFIEHTGQINFRPYFSPRGSTYLLDSECNLFILPPAGVEGAEAKKVGYWSDGAIISDEESIRQYEAQSQSCDFSDSCDNCHLSLMCGGACSRESMGVAAHGNSACAAAFTRRLERVLPSVLFNKHDGPVVS